MLNSVSTDYTVDNGQYRRPPSYEESMQLSSAFSPSSPASSVVPDVAGSDAASTSPSTLLDDIMECIQLDKAPQASPRTPGKLMFASFLFLVFLFFSWGEIRVPCYKVLLTQ